MTALKMDLPVMPKDIRPTSPHLSVYRWQITMVMSILHRITGVGLMLGTVLLVIWLYVAAYDAPNYSYVHGLMSSVLGKLMLLGWTAAFYYHLGNGIRHLFWDMGQGFTIPQTNRSGWVVLIFTLLMTLATWCPYMADAAQ